MYRCRVSRLLPHWVLSRRSVSALLPGGSEVAHAFGGSARRRAASLLDWLGERVHGLSLLVSILTFQTLRLAVISLKRRDSVRAPVYLLSSHLDLTFALLFTLRVCVCVCANTCICRGASESTWQSPVYLTPKKMSSAFLLGVRRCTYIIGVAVSLRMGRTENML